MAMMEYVHGEIPKRNLTEGEEIITQLMAVRLVAALPGSVLKKDELLKLLDRTIEYIDLKKHFKPNIRAHWITYPKCLEYDGAYSDDHIVCAWCNEVFSISDNDTERFDYCPKCGAKMDLIDEDDGSGVGQAFSPD